MLPCLSAVMTIMAVWFVASELPRGLMIAAGRGNRVKPVHHVRPLLCSKLSQNTWHVRGFQNSFAVEELLNIFMRNWHCEVYKNICRFDVTPIRNPNVQISLSGRCWSNSYRTFLCSENLNHTTILKSMTHVYPIARYINVHYTWDDFWQTWNLPCPPSDSERNMGHVTSVSFLWIEKTARAIFFFLHYSP